MHLAVLIMSVLILSATKGLSTVAGSEMLKIVIFLRPIAIGQFKQLAVLLRDQTMGKLTPLLFQQVRPLSVFIVVATIPSTSTQLTLTVMTFDAAGPWAVQNAGEYVKVFLEQLWRRYVCIQTQLLYAFRIQI